jgi:ornithine cyclodeaminase/alanine dehydrogenase-like protein (mu-crystallin family)
LKIVDLAKAFAFDREHGRAQKFEQEFSQEHKIDVQAIDNLPQAVGQSDIVVTCTPSKQFFLEKKWVAPGTFIAAVGADSEDKQEIDPALLRGNKVVVDLVEQCATIGELHHALVAGHINKEQVYAELGQIVAGTKSGRATSEEIVIFDSTGMALQDVVTAALVFEKAVTRNAGWRVNLAD